MLSLFPQLFDYQQFAPLILRIAIAFVVIGFGYPKILKPLEYRNFIIGLTEFCAGIFLLAGFLTQLAALLVIITALIENFRPTQEKKYGLILLLVAASLALMLFGPGLFSFDLPL